MLVLDLRFIAHVFELIAPLSTGTADRFFEEFVLAGVRVLLVEDEALIRTVIAEVLSDAGLEVFEAANGDEATALIDGPDGFDLLLTDIQMPGSRSGVEVARRFRQRHPERPIVYTTGRPDSLSEVEQLGPHESFLRKPYGAMELLGIVRRVLSLD